MNISISLVKVFVFIFIMKMFIGCATDTAIQKKDMKIEGESVPEWVYNIDESCNNALHICASAEGENSQSADLNAKNSLASIFETKINSKFTLEKYGFTGPEAEAIKERISSNVTESVNTILKSSRIKERFIKNDLYFSLAVLDKKKVKKSLRLEIKALDDKLDYHLKRGMKSSLIKMHLLLNKRNLLNDKYIIVAGSGIPANVSFSQINSIRFRSSGNNIISVKAVGTVPRIIQQRIESMLTEMGYKIRSKNSTNKSVKKIAKPSNYTVKLKYKSKDEYLNVKGFKKYSFALSVESRSSSGGKLGTYTSESIGLGRNLQDAFLKIKNKLVEDIRKNIDQLNIN